jgi:hypothetical protein
VRFAFTHGLERWAELLTRPNSFLLHDSEPPPFLIHSCPAIAAECESALLDRCLTSVPPWPGTYTHSSEGGGHFPVQCVRLRLPTHPSSPSLARTNAARVPLLQSNLSQAVDALIETSLANPREAGLLGTDVGLPMLMLSRHSRDAGGEPVEWVRSVYRGDRYKFVANLERPR